MGEVLVYIDPTGSSERLLALARPLADALGGPVVALKAAGAAVAPNGTPTAADVILEMHHPSLTPYLPEAHQAALAAAVQARTPDLVLVENTTAGYDLGAAVAAQTGLPFVGYGVALALVEGELECLSGVYGGQFQSTSRTALPAVVAINSAALTEDPASPGRGQHVAIDAPAALDGLRTTFLEEIIPESGGLDLSKADRIVCVGRGIGGPENIELAQELADKLGAELAASRPVVDSGWLPKAHQVGKSGARVKPRLYLTLGVSGAPEHLEGMQGSELIVAVNKDPGAAIFGVAHYGFVGDLFDVADELTSLLG